MDHHGPQSISHSISQSVTEFAEQVFFGDSLSVKLWTPDGPLTDVDCSSKAISAHRKGLVHNLVPHRPPELPLEGPRGSKSMALFPKRSTLDDDRNRGLVLHFFANHELLALELMAMALILWPDAQASFRQGIVQTMKDEQRHLKLYLARMKELQVEFGDAPLNSFFWKCMRHMASPVEYAAAMSMTFEQANLDFSLHYESLFGELGDRATASILQVVRLDEIGHVKHGYVWFERWRPKCNSLFDEWQATLKFPMTPARAKGLTFDQGGRAAAGLPADFIRELEVHNQSKGRPPVVFWFNPACEDEIESQNPHWTPSKYLQALAADYGILMSLLAKNDDIVMVDAKPSVRFLSSLRELGLPMPEFRTHGELNSLLDRKFATFAPWGWSPRAAKYFEPLAPRRLTPPTHKPSYSSQANESIFSKQVSAQMRANHGWDQIATISAKSMVEVLNSIAACAQHSPRQIVVIKAPFSAAGRGMVRIVNGQSTPPQIKWIEHQLNLHGVVLIEPWLEKVVDLSAHIDIADDGTIKFLGTTRFWTDGRGQYRGHIIGQMLDCLPLSIIKKWYGDRDDNAQLDSVESKSEMSNWKAKLEQTVLTVGSEAYRRGYVGPLGIDAFIYRDSESVKLRPMIEINPRWSMGRIALVLDRHIAPKHTGVWIHISKKQCVEAGHQSFDELCKRMAGAQPKVLRTLHRHVLIESGIFSLNDPVTAVQSLALLVVGRKLEDCVRVLKSGGINDQQLELQTQSGGGLS